MQPAGVRHPAEPGAGVHGRVALDPALHPVERLVGRQARLRAERRRADPVRGRRVGQPAAEPVHRDRDARGTAGPVVLDRLVEGEERVVGALRDERRDLDLRDQLVLRAARVEVGEVRLVEVPGGEAGRDRVRRLRILLAAELELGQTLAVGAERADAVEDDAPAALRRVVLVEAGEQRVPGDLRRDRVDPVVHRREHVLDAAAVARADHAEPRVARPVELRLRLLGDQVDQRLRVAALELRRVGHHVARGGAEAARVPGEHVVAVVEVAGDDRVVLRRPALGVAGPVHDRRRLRPARELVRRIEVVGDLGPVEGRDGAVAGRGGGGRRNGTTERDERGREEAAHDPRK